MGFGRPRRMILRWLFLLGAAGGAAFPLSASGQTLAAAPHAQAANPARVSETALKGDRARTKFIIGLERSVEFQVFSLTNPNRVFVELPDVMLQLPPQPGETAVGLVKSFRGGQSAPGKARIVIDVTGPVVVDRAAIVKSKDGKTAQLVLEIVPVGPCHGCRPKSRSQGRRQAGDDAGRRRGARRGRRAAAHAQARGIAAAARARRLQARDRARPRTRRRRHRGAEERHRREGRGAGLQSHAARQAQRHRPLQGADDARHRRVRGAEQAPRVRRAQPGPAVRGGACRLRPGERARRHHLLAARVGGQLAAALRQGRVERHPVRQGAGLGPADGRRHQRDQGFPVPISSAWRSTGTAIAPACSSSR